MMSNNMGVEMGFKFLSKTNVISTMSLFKNDFMPGFFKFGFIINI